ncbi:MAG: tetratricopeptide repeat protein [Polyangia bacterium]
MNSRAPVRALSAACSVLVLVGCAQLQPAPIDPATRRFPQKEGIERSELLTRKLWPAVGKVGFTYLRIAISQPSPIGDMEPRLRPFCEDALRQIGFPKVESIDYMVQLLIKNNLDDKINLEKLDYLAQARLASAAGPFVIVDMTLERAGSGLRFSVRVIDAAKPEKVFEATHEKRMIMSSYDTEVLYPVINELKAWFDESSALPGSTDSVPPPHGPATTATAAAPTSASAAPSANRSKDESRAAAFKQVCDGGDMGGCNNLGAMYANGKGVVKDNGRAVALYKQACDGGNMVGCTNLGAMYASGMGVAKDGARAAALYEQACDNDNQPYCFACNNLAGMYASGEGVVKDGARAAALCKRARDGGLGNACSGFTISNLISEKPASR